MEIWQIVLIIIGSFALLFLFFLLIGWIIWLCLSPLEKKIQNEFDKLQPFEKNRIETLKKAWTYVDEKNIGYKRDFRQLFEKAYEDIDNPDQNERRKAKETIDFASLYTRKLLEEKGKGTQESVDIINELLKNQKESDTIYQDYDKLAVRYNASLSTFTVKIVNNMAGKKKKYLAVLY